MPATFIHSRQEELNNKFVYCFMHDFMFGKLFDFWTSHRERLCTYYVPVAKQGDVIQDLLYRI